MRKIKRNTQLIPEIIEVKEMLSWGYEFFILFQRLDFFNRLLKSNRELESGNSPFNQMEFFVKNMIKATVNTALPVRVVKGTI